MRVCYRVEWNTGDDYWDNDPDCAYYNTIEEVKEAIGDDFTEENINDLEKDGYTCDDDCVEWAVIKEEVKKS
jgi:hypothetical protein